MHGAPRRTVSDAHPWGPGQAVRIRGERWNVLHYTAYDGCGVLEVAGTDTQNAGLTCRVLLPFEPTDRLPAYPERPRIVRPSALRRIACDALASTTPSWTSLRAAASADIALLPFQLEPAIAMARGAGCRFLLADEVGLGKTVQAGLMIAELLAREDDARILVVTPAGLREQWRDELHARFAIDADVIDAAGLARATAQLPSGVNPWAIPSVAITSIDFVKRADVIRALEPLVWDLVVFDEVHGLSGRSDRTTAAGQIASRGRRVAMLTATPHSGDPRGFERLCSLGQLDDRDDVLLFRRTRSDAGVRTSRRVCVLRVGLSGAERRMHAALAAYIRHVRRDAPESTAAAAHLAMNVLARRACSSAASFGRSVERRMGLLEDAVPLSEIQLSLPLDEGTTSDDEEPGTELAAPGMRDTGAERRWLERLLVLARAAETCETKVAAIARFLRRTRESAIVFTEYRDTLERLGRAFDRSDVCRSAPAARLHGGLSPAERAAELGRFTSGGAPLLLATDAASEGLNLHHRCRLVVNLEVPWTPLRFEQRVGRVDRLGQRARVHAVTLVARNTIEESVTARFRERLERVTEALSSTTQAMSGGIARVDLRDESKREVERLQLVRALASSSQIRSRRPPHSRSAVEAARSAAPARPGRPQGVAAALRGGGDTSVHWAVRLMFVDAGGNVVWDTIVAPVVRSRRPPSFERPADLREWLARLHQHLAPQLAAAAADAHDCECARVAIEVAAACERLSARELAMVRMLRDRDARLARPLVQSALFDRRALRHAEAQRRLSDLAIERSTVRLDARQRLLSLRPGDRHLVFVLVRTR
jgi:superfamily II DNA or RNA helicase